MAAQTSIADAFRKPLPTESRPHRVVGSVGIVARAGPVRLNRFPRTISGFLPGSLQIAVFAAA
jgi:hypothetical protein